MPLPTVEECEAVAKQFLAAQADAQAAVHQFRVNRQNETGDTAEIELRLT